MSLQNRLSDWTDADIQNSLDGIAAGGWDDDPMAFYAPVVCHARSKNVPDRTIFRAIRDLLGVVQ